MYCPSSSASKMGDIPEECIFTFNMGIDDPQFRRRPTTWYGPPPGLKAAVIGEIVKGGERITIC